MKVERIESHVKDGKSMRGKLILYLQIFFFKSQKPKYE